MCTECVFCAFLNIASLAFCRNRCKAGYVGEALINI